MRILPPYPPELSAKAEASLAHLGVTIRTQTLVTNIAEDIITVRQGETEETIAAETVLWAAGVKASKVRNSPLSPPDSSGSLKKP